MKKLLLIIFLIFNLSHSQNNKCVSGNCIEGYGTFINADGEKYIGEFSEGKCDGLGWWMSKKFKDESFTYSGEFKDNKINGLGKLVVFNNFEGHDLPIIAYSGHWKNGKKHGMIKVDDYFNEIEKWCVYMNDELKEVLYEFDRSVKK